MPNKSTKTQSSRLIVYIAMSLDGFIADLGGSVDWLDEYSNPENDFGYGEFLEGVSTLMMGRKSYEKIREFDIPWPYDGKKTYVVSSDPKLKIRTRDTWLISSIDEESIEKIRSESEKNIWVLGGGILIRYLIELNVIDMLDLFIMPGTLGEGIHLFPASKMKSRFRATESTVYDNGVVNIKYHKA
jgi:dihydrofolate reductase